MCPENAKIFLVDDDEGTNRSLSFVLRIYGHTIVETATTLDEALEKIPSLDEKGVNVAIVDGNLSMEGQSGDDGEIVARQIKAQHPEIVVIGHATRNLIRNADVNCPKPKGPTMLNEIILKS